VCYEGLVKFLGGVIVVASSHDRLLVYGRLNREWRPHLDVYERDFLSYLVDNSVSWGRTWLRATVEQMINGAQSLTGKQWLRPLGQCRRKVFQVLKRLTDIGLLTITKGAKRVSVFALNIEWNPDMALAVSKKQQQRIAERESGEVHPGAKSEVEDPFFSAPDALETDGSVHQTHTYKLVGKINELVPSDAPRHGGGLTAEQALAKVRERKRPTRTDKEHTIKSAWAEGFAAGYPGIGVPTLSVRDLGVLGKLRDRLASSTFDWNDFLIWSLTNWRVVCAERFGWMTNSPPPETPKAGFLSKLVNHFLEAYAVRQENELLAVLPLEQAEIRKLTNSGMSYADALIEIGKRRGAAADRGQLDKERADLARTVRAMERDRSTARAVPVGFRQPAPEVEVAVDRSTNPYEAGGGSMADFSGLPPWSDD
jgi:hypothetical protein